jgi:phage tail-like protein
MTQARSSPAISLLLTPMQIPEALPHAALPHAASATSPTRNLVLRPGEPSELVVQIRNLGDRPLQLILQVEADFPSRWYQMRTEGTQIPPGQQSEAVLYFQVPQDWFEQDGRPVEVGGGELGASELGASEYKLDYHGKLHAQTLEPRSGQWRSETAGFNLYLRPHSLYPRFLPALYGEVDFVGRFLKLFEQSFEPAVHSMDALWAHLDPLTAPAALLPFLAHWVGWSEAFPVSLERQRYLIRHALEIYRWRGTKRGLRFYLHLVTGLPLDPELPEAEKHIGIFESFSRGFVAGEARLSEDTILGGGRPFHFTIQLRPPPDPGWDEALVRQIIEQEKPAFCSYDLLIV